jgi:hypothetical protein
MKKLLFILFVIPIICICQNYKVGNNAVNLDTMGVVLYSNATMFDDLRIDGLTTPSNLDEPALTNSFAGSALLFQRVFQGSIRDDKIYFNIQLPHSWKQGGEFEIHLHNSAWTNPVATDTCVWQFNYAWDNINGIFDTINTVTVKQPLGATAQWKHNKFELYRFTVIGKTMSSVLACSIYRLANSNASDTYTGGMTILYIDCHYEIDGLGSPKELYKPY